MEISCACGSVSYTHLDVYKRQRVHIHAKETQKLSMDGEIVPFTHLEVAVEKGGLSFVVPKGSALLEERDVME